MRSFDAVSRAFEYMKHMREEQQCSPITFLRRALMAIGGLPIEPFIRAATL